jgi:hypothetical protein
VATRWRNGARNEVAVGPFCENSLIADDVSDEVEQALRHLLLDYEICVLDDDLFADIR